MDELFIEVPISNVSTHSIQRTIGGENDFFRLTQEISVSAEAEACLVHHRRARLTRPRPFGARGPTGLFGEVGLSGQLFNNLFTRGTNS